MSNHLSFTWCNSYFPTIFCSDSMSCIVITKLKCIFLLIKSSSMWPSWNLSGFHNTTTSFGFIFNYCLQWNDLLLYNLYDACLNLLVVLQWPALKLLGLLFLNFAINQCSISFPLPYIWCIHVKLNLKPYAQVQELFLWDYSDFFFCYFRSTCVSAEFGMSAFVLGMNINIGDYGDLSTIQKPLFAFFTSLYQIVVRFWPCNQQEKQGAYHNEGTYSRWRVWDKAEAIDAQCP